jgi:hypothetical protein
MALMSTALAKRVVPHALKAERTVTGQGRRHVATHARCVTGHSWRTGAFLQDLPHCPASKQKWYKNVTEGDGQAFVIVSART